MNGEYLALNGTTSGLGVQLGCRGPGELAIGLPNYFVQLQGPNPPRRGRHQRMMLFNSCDRTSPENCVRGDTSPANVDHESASAGQTAVSNDEFRPRTGVLRTRTTGSAPVRVPRRAATSTVGSANYASPTKRCPFQKSPNCIRAAIGTTEGLHVRKHMTNKACCCITFCLFVGSLLSYAEEHPQYSKGNPKADSMEMLPRNSTMSRGDCWTYWTSWS